MKPHYEIRKGYGVDKIFYKDIRRYLRKGMRVLEIGGGAFPAVEDRRGIEYYIADPDERELAKAPDDVVKLQCKIQELSLNKKFDLILSKMVLEHVEDPDSFHKKVISLSAENGVIVHYYACHYSIPSIANLLLPEKVGEYILSKILKNRDTHVMPKYPAYYRRTRGHIGSQTKYFRLIGYDIVAFYTYVGHRYFYRFPIIYFFERVYTTLLYKLKAIGLATTAIVILQKKSN